MATDPTDPLPDIEAAIKAEVDGINRTKRPPMRLSTEPKPGEPPPPRYVIEPTAEPVPEPPPIEAVPLPVILAVLSREIDDIKLTLARIERVLGITP